MRGALPRAMCGLWRGVGAVAMALATASAAGEPVRYRLDPMHSFVSFELLHFGTSTIRGRIGPVNGEVELDRTQRRGRVQLTLEMASASTGVPVLDARLKEPDMLAVREHPQAWFVADRFEFDDAGRVGGVRGELTLRGTSMALGLKALRFNCYTSPLLRVEVCGGDFEGSLVRSAAGITHSLPFVSDTVRLLVQVEAVRGE